MVELHKICQSTRRKTVNQMVSSIGSVSALVALTVLSIQLASASRAHHGFFQALSESQKEQVSAILSGGLTKAEIREQLRHWVSSQPKETQVGMCIEMLFV